MHSNKTTAILSSIVFHRQKYRAFYVYKLCIYLLYKASIYMLVSGFTTLKRQQNVLHIVDIHRNFFGGALDMLRPVKKHCKTITEQKNVPNCLYRDWSTTFCETIWPARCPHHCPKTPPPERGAPTFWHSPYCP